jgi:hypothetical protein
VDAVKFNGSVANVLFSAAGSNPPWGTGRRAARLRREGITADVFYRFKSQLNAPYGGR